MIRRYVFATVLSFLALAVVPAFAQQSLQPRATAQPNSSNICMIQPASSQFCS
jgi:hypothetical protein